VVEAEVDLSLHASVEGLSMFLLEARRVSRC
jgi:hypothetical protein